MTFDRYAKLLRLASHKKLEAYAKVKREDWKIHNRSIRKHLVQSRVVTFV